MFHHFIKIFLSWFRCVQEKIHIVEKRASKTIRGSIELMVLERNNLFFFINIIVGELLRHLFRKFLRRFITFQGKIIMFQLILNILGTSMFSIRTAKKNLAGYMPYATH